MTIKDLKDLEKTIKLCRRLGVETLKVDGIEIALGQYSIHKETKRIPYKSNMDSTLLPIGITEDTKIEIEELTEEQLMFYSAVQGEIPENQQ